MDRDPDTSYIETYPELFGDIEIRTQVYVTPNNLFSKTSSRQRTIKVLIDRRFGPYTCVRISINHQRGKRLPTDPRIKSPEDINLKYVEDADVRAMLTLANLDSPHIQKHYSTSNRNVFGSEYFGKLNAGVCRRRASGPLTGRSCAPFGPTLRSLTDYTYEQACDIADQIVHGLCELHNKQIVHGNLCPDTISIVNGQSKIISFGSARVVWRDPLAFGYDYMGLGRILEMLFAPFWNRVRRDINALTIPNIKFQRPVFEKLTARYKTMYGWF